MKKRKRIIYIVLCNCSILLFGIVLLELIFGGWINPQRLNRLNLIRSQTLKFEVKGLYESDEPYITYTRDEYGLRGSFDHPREIDLLTVGGSTTDQRFVGDGETWQDVLQESFAKVGKNIVVGNAGVDGQSTFGHILNFELWFPYVPELSPKYILYYIGINDLWKVESSNYDQLVPNDDNGNSIRQVLRNNSAFWHMVKTLRSSYRAKFVYQMSHRAIDYSTLEWTSEPLYENHRLMWEKPLALFAERLDALIEKTREFGSEPILVTQPTRRYRRRNGIVEGVHDRFLGSRRLKKNGVDYFYFMSELNKITLSVGKEKKVYCVDMMRYIELEDEDFYDFTHMTPKGAQKVGEFIFKSLDKQLAP
jgi:hypothetical protein